MPRTWAYLIQVVSAVARFYDKVQVELQGQYSLARLHEFADFQANTGLARALAIVLLTPLPCLVVIIVLDLLPMNSAYLGVYDQTIWFWFRAAFSLSLITMCVILQLHQSAPTLPMPRFRLCVISAVLGITSAAMFYAIGVVIGFPTPFAVQICAVPWFWGLVAALGVSWVPTLRVDNEARNNLTRYLVAYSSELAIIFAYPIYYYVFSQLSGAGQTAFSLILPIMKLTFKNWVSYGMLHMEDLAPTTIVFNIDVFHALFLSTTAQKSKSIGSTMIIMSVDAFQMMVAFSEIHKVQIRLRRFRSRQERMDSSGPVSTCQSISFARQLVTTNARVREHPDLAFPRHLRRDPLQIQSSASVTNMRLTSKKVRPSLRYIDGRVLATDDEDNANEVASNDGVPTDRPVQSPPLTKREKIQVKSVACVLQMLHMTEFYVLIEFAEVMMTGLFAIYLSVITRLPNRVHYVNLRSLSEEELRDTTDNVALFAMLELLSFVVLCVGLNWKLPGFSSIRQLAFSLRKHWRMAQAMLVLWGVFVMQLSLTHAGSDYSFKFAWLHNNATGSM